MADKHKILSELTECQTEKETNTDLVSRKHSEILQRVYFVPADEQLRTVKK